MARAVIRIVRERLPEPVVYYYLYDNQGRLIRSDNTCGRWAEFMRTAEREVGALNILEHMGHQTEHTWDELVDRAQI